MTLEHDQIYEWMLLYTRTMSTIFTAWSWKIGSFDSGKDPMLLPSCKNCVRANLRQRRAPITQLSNSSSISSRAFKGVFSSRTDLAGISKCASWQRCQNFILRSLAWVKLLISFWSESQSMSIVLTKREKSYSSISISPDHYSFTWLKRKTTF